MSPFDLFLDINSHLLKDQIPSEYLNYISKDDLFTQVPFSMLLELKKTEQSPKYHPEGNVWNHTMLVVDEAASIRNESRDAQIFMWAALLHDIGKPSTTKSRKGRITSYDHDKAGEKLSWDFLAYFSSDYDFLRAVSSLVRWHMQILFVTKDLPFAEIEDMKRQTDIHEVALLSLCDRLGRLRVDREKEEADMKEFLAKIKQ